MFTKSYFSHLELLRTIRDPEKPSTLEDLKVVYEDGIFIQSPTSDNVQVVCKQMKRYTNFWLIIWTNDSFSFIGSSWIQSNSAALFVGHIDWTLFTNKNRKEYCT